MTPLCVQFVFTVNQTWLSVSIYVLTSHTEFTIHLSDAKFTVKSLALFFRYQWTRICFSFDSNTSIATLVVNGDQLDKRIIKVDDKPAHLNMILGNYQNLQILFWIHSRWASSEPGPFHFVWWPW